MTKPDYKALYLASYTERQVLSAENEKLRAKLETVEPEYVGALRRIVAVENRARRAEDRVALLERLLENAAVLKAGVCCHGVKTLDYCQACEDMGPAF